MFTVSELMESFHYLMQIHSIVTLQETSQLSQCYGSVVLSYTHNCIKLFVPIIFS